MIPVVWAQAIGEYGAMATIAAKIALLYSQIESSIRTDPERWLLAVLAIVLVLWLLRR